MPSRLSRLRARLTFANVTSALALFVALGGTSYAAVSVGSAEIRTDAVGASEIRRDAVGASEVRRNAIGTSEVRTNGIGKSEIQTGAVGRAELAPDSVYASELAPGSVGTDELQDGQVALADLSTQARTALTQTDRAMVSSGGVLAGGTAKLATRTATGAYAVTFAHDVSTCTYTATLAGVKSGTTVEDPAPGSVTVAPATSPATDVVVKTYDPAGAATDGPFHVVATC
jgi:hypothetical protein